MQAGLRTRQQRCDDTSVKSRHLSSSPFLGEQYFEHNGLDVESDFRMSRLSGSGLDSAVDIIASLIQRILRGLGH